MGNLAVLRPTGLQHVLGTVHIAPKDSDGDPDQDTIVVMHGEHRNLQLNRLVHPNEIPQARERVIAGLLAKMGPGYRVVSANIRIGEVIPCFKIREHKLALEVRRLRADQRGHATDKEGIEAKINRILAVLGDHPKTCEECRIILQSSVFVRQYYCPQVSKFV